MPQFLTGMVHFFVAYLIARNTVLTNRLSVSGSTNMPFLVRHLVG
ncbi:hypothetical protein FUAX_45230 (plasmid) [Fulvitalea axinellae]|uniref:Uncharacterized protein n=1 Tax=Fulvitalea axinellae TaxID=1182444 RepID=A0AAU9CSL6_9BACT|nr:hypothetical protein FUAX_45230 [Fulvitalea axinellae]